MQNTRSTTKDPDTGQNDSRNEITDLTNPYPDSKLDKLHPVNRKKSNNTNSNNTNNNTNKHRSHSKEELSTKGSGITQDNEIYDNPSISEQQSINSAQELLQEYDMDIDERNYFEGFRGVSIEMHFSLEDEKWAKASIIEYTIELIQQWKITGMIDGVLGHDNKLLDSYFDQHDLWVVTPRIIRKKEYVMAESIVMVKSEISAFQLYHNQKDYCDKNHIKLSSKNTILEYTNKIGYLSDTYVKLASPKHYIQDLNRKLQIQEGRIDIKKEYTYEKGKRSKVLTVYAISSEVKEINERLCQVKFSRYRYISYKNTPSDLKLASMHTNEMKNIKAKYETIYNMSLTDDYVLLKETRSYQKLEKYLMGLKVNNDQLFLAAEQGSGKFEDNVTVVINPRTASQSRKWLAIDSKEINFRQEDKVMETSVNAEEFQHDIKYNEQLKEFLKPTLQLGAAKKVKGFGKNMKSYVEAVGISVTPPQQKKNKSIEKQNSMNNVPTGNTSAPPSQSNATIIQLSIQINQLKEIIRGLCHALVQDNQEKSRILQQMNNIGTCSVETVQLHQQNNENEQPITAEKQHQQHSNKKETEKRKEREIRISLPYQFTEADIQSGKVECYNNWSEGNIVETSSTKRVKPNESK